MTTTTTSPTTKAPYRRGLTAPAARVTFAGVLASEWAKLLTLRSTAYIAIAALLVSVGGSELQAIATASAPAGALHLTAAQATSNVITSGTLGSQLVLAVLAVLIMSSEYSTGTIATTMASVPRRLPVLAAKAIVVTIVAAVLGVASALLGYAATFSRLRAAELSVPLFDAAGIRAILAAAVYLIFIALFALLVATVVRNTAAAIALVMAVLFVLPAALSFTIGDTGVSPSQFTLTYAAQMTTAALADPSTAAHLGRDLALLVAWLGVPAIAGVALLQRRDA